MQNLVELDLYSIENIYSSHIFTIYRIQWRTTWPQRKSLNFKNKERYGQLSLTSRSKWLPIAHLPPSKKFSLKPWNPLLLLISDSKWKLKIKMEPAWWNRGNIRLKWCRPHMEDHRFNSWPTCTQWGCTSGAGWRESCLSLPLLQSYLSLSMPLTLKN